MNCWDSWRCSGSAAVDTIFVHFWKMICEAIFWCVVQSHGSHIVELAPSIPCCH